MKKSRLYFIAILLLVLYALSAQALTISPNSQLDTSLEIGENSGESEEKTEIDTDSRFTSTTTNKDSTVMVDINNSIRFERDDIKDTDNGIEIIDSSSVNTTVDLSNYAKSMILSDQNIKEVNFEKDKVEITYEKEGKVMGLIKTKYEIETTVDSNGKIEVDYPWYASFIRGSNKPQVRQRMDKEISVFLDKNTNASGEIELNASVEAKLGNLIHTILVEELNEVASLGSYQSLSTTNE